MASLSSIKKIAIIGAGTMGQGIAQICAQAGYDVLLYDAKSDVTQEALARIEQRLESSVKKSKLSDSEKDAILNRIKAADDFRELQVDLAIEAVAEKLDVKQKIVAELEKLNDRSCLIVSNTSSIPITQIASVLKHQHRFAGLHFFNPAPVMKLVEIVKGASTDNDTIELLKAFSLQLNKVSVMANDSPGFIVNRVARHFYVEALKVLEDGVADFQTIDQLVRATGFKMGPFELMDLIGVDVNFSVTTSMFQAFHHDDKFRPSRIQQQKVNAGHNGRKNGKGFYEYPTQ